MDKDTNSEQARCQQLADQIIDVWMDGLVRDLLFQEHAAAVESAYKQRIAELEAFKLKHRNRLCRCAECVDVEHDQTGE